MKEDEWIFETLSSMARKVRKSRAWTVLALAVTVAAVLSALHHSGFERVLLVLLGVVWLSLFLESLPNWRHGSSEDVAP
jgi:chromate transport protein ChrA